MLIHVFRMEVCITMSLTIEIIIYVVIAIVVL